MGRYLIAYAASAVTFFVIDLIWLGVVAREFYRRQYGDLLSDQPLYGAAGAFYLAYVVGIVIFAVSPAMETGRWTTALVYGALFGLFCYGTYDMTNLAVIRNWPVQATFVDIAWGTALTATAAVAGYAAVSRFG